MKTFLGSVFFAIMTLSFSSLATAKPLDLPQSASVSATMGTDGLVTLRITGVKLVRVELYIHESIRVLRPKHPTTEMAVKIDPYEGRRFNFVFENDRGEWFALVTPEMEESKPEWMGEGVAAECSTPASRKLGCALAITAQ